ncbi:MAG: nuclear transport factor 2 family protein [Pseudomonadota bacterium]
MEDRDAILALMGEYCDSIDRGDLAGCAELFADGSWGIEGDLAQGSDAVKAVLDNVTLYDGRPMTRHLTSNVQITVDEDSAKAQSCITVMQGLPDFPLQAIFIGTYFDRFERRGDEWVWRERRIQPDLVGDLSRHRSDMAAD